MKWLEERRHRLELERHNGIDRIEERQRFASELARTIDMSMPGCVTKAVQLSVDGPLGGQSERVTVVQMLPTGRITYMINVYAMGVFADGDHNEEKR